MEKLFQRKKSALQQGYEWKTALTETKGVGLCLPEEFACFPPIILDDVSTFWAVRDGGDFLTSYKFFYFFLTSFLSSGKQKGKWRN